MGGTRPWAIAADGITLALRLTPKSGSNAIDGVVQLADGCSVLKARVAAAPSEGEANAALMRLIAKAVGVPPRDVLLTAGASSRIKHVKISGDGQALIGALEKIVAKG